MREIVKEVGSLEEFQKLKLDQYEFLEIVNTKDIKNTFRKCFENIRINLTK